MFPSQSTGTPVAFSTVEATWLTSNWSGEAILRVEGDRQRDHEDQEEEREPVPPQRRGPEQQREHAGQADQEGEVAQERDRHGIVTSLPRTEASQQQEPPSQPPPGRRPARAGRPGWRSRG